MIQELIACKFVHLVSNITKIHRQNRFLWRFPNTHKTIWVGSLLHSEIVNLDVKDCWSPSRPTERPTVFATSSFCDLESAHVFCSASSLLNRSAAIFLDFPYFHVSMHLQSLGQATADQACKLLASVQCWVMMTNQQSSGGL